MAEVGEHSDAWSDFKKDNTGALVKGKELTEAEPDWSPWVSRFMLKHHRFPEPIIVLDNRDGHHNVDYPEEDKLPRAYILMEGHIRFNVGIYMESIGDLEPQDVWLMIKVRA